MPSSSPYQLTINQPFNENELRKGLYLVVIRATQTPPHIGLLIDNSFHSLNIKGHDINRPAEALFKTMHQKSAPSLFIKIKPHAILDTAELSNRFVSYINQFTRVELEGPTCFSPIKLFFEEVYGVSMKDVTYFYELIPRLKEMNLIEHTSGLFLEQGVFILPAYTKEELSKGIATNIAKSKETNE